MAIARVQEISGDWTTGSSWSTASFTGGNGNTLAISVHWQSSNNFDDVLSVDVTSNTVIGPVNMISQSAGGILVSLSTWYVKNLTGGSLTCTVTASGSAARATVKVHEFSGADTSSPLDQFVMQRLAPGGLGSDDITSSAKTTTATGEYIFGAALNETGNLAYTHGTNFSDGVLDSWTASEYQIWGSSGSIAATFAATFGDVVNFLVGMMTFLPAGGGGSTDNQEWLTKTVVEKSRSSRMVGY